MPGSAGDDQEQHPTCPVADGRLSEAVAANDDESTPEAKVTLAEAYAAADLSAEIEVYGGTLHGWCPPDSQVYNEAQAERAWSRLLNLFENNLA